jgi:hypothetical protein
MDITGSYGHNEFLQAYGIVIHIGCACRTTLIKVTRGIKYKHSKKYLTSPLFLGFVQIAKG